ncbi:MAG: STAS domain-containing protein [Betaproteobacteria bacterium]|nr:STAS domain-containing protein [Betaproteobacteria bacterium]
MNATASTGRLAIDQDMTIYQAEALKDELMGNVTQTQVIELDLSRVSEIDTAGIQLLMLAKRECQKQGKTLRIVAHSPRVHELMDFFNIAGFFGDPLVIPARESA